MKNNVTAEFLIEHDGKFFNFPVRSFDEDRTALPSSGGITYTSGTDVGVPHLVKSIERRHSFTDVFESVQPRDREMLNSAFDRISQAIDTQFDMAELSNAYDEWKDALGTASRKIESLTGSHRKIIGMLLSLLHGKDISDFNIETLRIFQEATNTLRLPRIGKQDSRRIIGELIKDGKKVMMPLSVNESEKNKTDNLEEMMAQLIAKSREDQ
jgi:hypothetical protein